MASKLRVPLRSLEPGDVVLEPDAGRYVSRVHRLGPGDAFTAFDPEHQVEADARILSVGREVTCRIDEIRPAKFVARSGVVLVQALGKGDKPERVVRDVTTLGVDRIILCWSRRTVSRSESGARSRPERFRAVAVDAARQCGRGDVPVIDGPVPLEEALRREALEPALRLCFVPDAGVPLARALGAWRWSEPLVVLVGPEGGFDESEMATAEAAGFQRVKFGNLVLRTETMAVAVLGALVGRE